MGARHMCARVYIYIVSYWYIYIYITTLRLQECHKAMFLSVCTWRFMPTLHYITPLQRLRPVCITLPADGWLHYITPHYVCSRLQPLLTTYLHAYYLIYNIVRTDYILNLNAQPTVCNRFTLFACVSTDYIGGEPPYLPPKRTAQPFHDIFLFLYFPILQFLFPRYSRIIFFIFFLHKTPSYSLRTIYLPLSSVHFPRYFLIYII